MYRSIILLRLLLDELREQQLRTVRYFFLMNFEFFDVCKKEKERARGKKEAIERAAAMQGVQGLF